MAQEISAFTLLHSRLPEPGPRAAAPVAAPAAAAPEDAPVPEAELKRAVAEMAQRFDSARTGLQFRMDREAGRMIVSVVDAHDGTVLRQLPSELALRIARNLDEYQAHLVKETA